MTGIDLVAVRAALADAIDSHAGITGYRHATGDPDFPAGVVGPPVAVQYRRRLVRRPSAQFVVTVYVDMANGLGEGQDQLDAFMSDPGLASSIEVAAPAFVAGDATNWRQLDVGDETNPIPVLAADLILTYTTPTQE